MKSLVLSVFVTCFASCCLSEVTPVVAQTQDEKDQQTPSDPLMRMLSQPRFSAIFLTEGEDIQKQLVEKIHVGNFEELLTKHPYDQDGSLEEQNSCLVLRVYTLPLQTETDWKQVTDRATAESRTVTSEEQDSGLSDYLRRIREVTEGFRGISRQGLMEGTLNHFAMLRIIEQTSNSMGDWNGTYGENIDVASLTPSQKALRREVEQLLALLEEDSKVTNAVEELSRQNHWPAVESEIRYSIQTGNGPEAIQDLIQRFADCEGLDAYAHDLLAQLQFRLAMSQNRTLPKSVQKFARLAVDGGVLNAYRVLYDYYHLQDDVTQARTIVEEGAAAGQKDCVFKLGCLKYVDNEYLSAEKLLIQALDAGVADATVFLGMIYETGGDGVQQDASKALKYFQQGLRANVPEAVEKVALLYFNGTLRAEVLNLQYQVPGLPRLPEPTNAEKQQISNYVQASVYMSQASKIYAERGDASSAERTRNISKIVEKAALEISVQSTTGAVSPNWTDEDDYRLNRSFERQIESRDRFRQEIEERNRKIDRIYNGY